MAKNNKKRSDFSSDVNFTDKNNQPKENSRSNRQNSDNNRNRKDDGAYNG